MNRQDLQNIFSQPYDSAVWQDMLINLFGARDIRTTPAELCSDQNDKVSGYQLGELTTSDDYSVGLFAFELKDNTNIKLNKVGLRSLVRSYIQYGYDAALAVYYNDSEWRLSFICDLCNEKTTPKRYTYVFGSSNESYRTAAERLISLTERRLSFEDIREAFSVEKLSKEFFREYKQQYTKFIAYIGDTKPNRDYVKKMLGRLVFLQFLQKKGWMGCSASCSNWHGGDLQYLQNLIKRYEGCDRLLSDVLEVLFFDTLNTKREGDIASSILGESIKIPYLNGGLFDRDTLDNKDIDFPYSYFADLMEFFSHYNFTIDENDPHDAEIGIDPEMLGHIFENLLEDNKDKGAFYTPKEIVQYMCRQSLIEYLQSKLGKNTALESFVNQHDTSAKFIIENAAEIENLLDNIKICDPAIGSGAFPMGILNEIFHCKMALDLTLNRAEVKKNIIQKSIYGVDIEQGAVDIARLRFWLSLVVEENEPQPLPNLDYKIMCGNSLLSRYALDTPIDEVFAEYNRKNKTNFTLEDYKALVSGYTTTSNKSQKANFRTKIEEIKSAFKTSLNDKDKLKRMKLQGKINALRADNLFGSATKAELKEAKELEKKLKTMLQNESDIQNNHLYKDAFEWRFEFPALLSDDGAFVGFDVVIGNPPYFIYQGNNAGELSALKCQREFDIAFGGKLNAYKLFLAKALKCLTKTDGIITYIFQNSFLADKQAEQLRKYTIDNAQIVVIDSYPERDSKRKRVFESVKMSVCTIVIRNTHSLEPFTVNVWKDKNKENGITSLFTKHIIKAIDPNAYTIPRIENKDIQTIIKVKQQSSNVKLKCFEGELNMTFHKEYFNFNINNPLILKGASIQRYYFTKEMSQGTVEYLEEKSYLMKYQKSGKSNHHNSERIAMQGMTGANDHTRLVMTYIPKDIYLANSCNYLLPSDDYDIKYVLALLNSKLLNWYFRCFSTNSNVNGYEVDDLPIKLVEIDVQQLFASIVDEILRIKGSDYKADTLELEARIDKMVYKLYELTPREIELVEGR